MFQSFFRRRSIDIRRDGCQKGNIWTLRAFGRNQLKIWYGGDFWMHLLAPLLCRVATTDDDIANGALGDEIVEVPGSAHQVAEIGRRRSWPASAASIPIELDAAGEHRGSPLDINHGVQLMDVDLGSHAFRTGRQGFCLFRK
ncbi:hypothetical protein [Ensifer canadensis]|uniref:hypothetical protein n=1 Tax=Ensifer canadensis TaxID=555315 RepID=UPI00148F5656|nr:hypothetical protein [Ensifer canadensis]